MEIVVLGTGLQASHKLAWRPETSFKENKSTNSSLPEANFWPGIISCQPVTRPLRVDSFAVRDGVHLLKTTSNGRQQLSVSDVRATRFQKSPHWMAIFVAWFQATDHRGRIEKQTCFAWF